MLENLEIIPVITVQPILCADPQVTVAVLKKGQPRVLRETVFDGKVLKTDTLPSAKFRSISKAAPVESADDPAGEGRRKKSTAINKYKATHFMAMQNLQIILASSPFLMQLTNILNFQKVVTLHPKEKISVSSILTHSPVLPTDVDIESACCLKRTRQKANRRIVPGWPFRQLFPPLPHPRPSCGSFLPVYGYIDSSG